MPYIPNWAWYVGGGIIVIVAIYFVSEYLNAATSLLPTGTEG